MEFLDKIINNAKSDLKVIILPESSDERTLIAAQKLKTENIVIPILIGSRPEIESLASKCNANISGIQIYDPKHDNRTNSFAEEFYEMRKAKGMTLDEAKKIMLDNVYFGTMMLYKGMADGLVSGAIHATADTLRPALQIIKTSPDVKIASSFFLMVFSDKTYLFADCGFVIDPTSDELADIAISTAKSANFFGIEPKVALLSFSTKGSAKHEKVDKVAKAVQILKDKNVDFPFDGELQFDAAIIPKVAQLKCPDSPLKGDANVFIFPNLDSGNISYKITQRLGGALALGPIIQGLKKPINDLSRGCSAEDIVNVCAITAVQAQTKKDL